MRHIATSGYHIFIFPTREEQIAYITSTSAREDLAPANRLFITSLRTNGVDCYGPCFTCPAMPPPGFSPPRGMSSCKATLLAHIARRHSPLYRRP